MRPFTLNAVQKPFALRLISIDEEVPRAFGAALLPIFNPDTGKRTKPK